MACLCLSINVGFDRIVSISLSVAFHLLFSVGGLHGRSSATLTGQQSCSQLKSLHIAGLHTWLTRWAMFSLCCAVQRWAAQSPSWFYHAGQINSRTMLLPLLQRFNSQMRVCLYHTPDLRGLLRLLVPQRFNETIGVQHIKVYLFDDSIIISGYERFPLFTHWVHAEVLSHSLLLSPLFNCVLALAVFAECFPNQSAGICYHC